MSAPGESRRPPADDTETTVSGAGVSHQLRAGDVLGGRFTIVQFLKSGGMGEVYEAADRELQDKRVAIKTLKAEIASNGDMRQRFEREVLVAREVLHRNLCPTYNLFTMQGPRGPVTFLEMRLIRGESLSERIKRQGKLPAGLALDVSRQMAAGLDAAHAAGVIHRDFKPGNVMLEGAGDDIRVSITDFGLSRLYNDDNTLAEPGHISGTLAYMAPELFPPESRPASPASDVFAFGIVLHEMLTGERPSATSRSEAALPAVPPEWRRTISGCLKHDPAKRFQSAGEALSCFGVANNRPVRERVRISRRTAIEIGAGATAAPVAAGWLAWTRLDALLHPLPDKRFVALMAWPPDSDPASRSLLNGILDVIASRLVRAEAYVKNLLVVRPADSSGQPVTEPKQVVAALGANLVLAASLRAAGDSVTVFLEVLDATRGAVLRQQRLSAPLSQASRLPERASVAAAGLLQIPLPRTRANDTKELENVSLATYQAYVSAEEVRHQPNDSGLDRAIAKYQDAVDTDPSFALAYARLAMAYLRKFQLTHERATLSLAERNSNRAAELHPESPKVRLSQALVLLDSGKTQEGIDRMSIALREDPGNPEILMAQARAYHDLDNAREEEGVYRRLLRERPNFWPAYNDLGWFLYRHGRSAEALVAFQEAGAVAPRVALPLVNSGTMLLTLNRKDEAVAAFQRSLSLAPTELAYLNLGNAAWEDKAYRKALEFYSKARDLNPNHDLTWRNIGDCYDVLGDPRQMIASYTRASAIVRDRLASNPRRGSEWMTLAYYDAKVGRREQAESDIREAEQRSATDLPSQFMKAQTLAVLGRKDDALRLVLECLDRGLSKVEVEMSPDLNAVRADSRFKRHLASASKTG